MGEKKAGLIKWYDSKRGFGIITADDGKEYFLYRSQLSPKWGEIKSGLHLTFEAISRPYHKGGYEAIKVELDDSQIPEPPEAKSAYPIPQLAQSAPVDSGTDYWFQSYSTETNNRSASQKTIKTKVVGVTYEGRQAVVALLGVGEEVHLVREPDNPYDKNAIRVVRKTGQCFGFISKHLAAGLASKLDEYGKPVEAVVTTVIGGYYSDSNIGVTIQFTLPKTSDNESDFD